MIMILTYIYIYKHTTQLYVRILTITYISYTAYVYIFLYKFNPTFSWSPSEGIASGIARLSSSKRVAFWKPGLYAQKFLMKLMLVVPVPFRIGNLKRLLKRTASLHLKIGRAPIGKDRVPTIHFQGRTVSFREGIWLLERW